MHMCHGPEGQSSPAHCLSSRRHQQGRSVRSVAARAPTGHVTRRLPPPPQRQSGGQSAHRRRSPTNVARLPGTTQHRTRLARRTLLARTPRPRAV
eukprot:4614003-Prymnesium_polylepis.1